METILEQCILALEVYERARKEYEEIPVSEEYIKSERNRRIYEAEYLIENGAEGLRIGCPFSGDTKFCYGNPAMKLPSGEKAFFLNANGAETNSGYRAFLVFLSKKFKDKKLPFLDSVF